MSFNDFQIRNRLNRLLRPGMSALSSQQLGDSDNDSDNDSDMAAQSSDSDNDSTMTPDSAFSNLNANQPMSPDEFAKIRAMFPMQTDAQDRLKAMLDRMPTRDQYKPSKFNIAMSAISGLGAGGPAGYWNGAPMGFKNDPGKQQQIISNTLYGPYNRAMADWQAQEKPLQELATSERYENSYNRQAMNNYLQNERGNRRIAATEQRNADLARQANERNDIARIRAVAYDFKTKHPDYKGWIANDGTLVMVNPQDPTQQVWTGIDTGKLDDATKINMQIQGRLDEITKQGANALAVAKQQGVNQQTTKATAPDTQTIEGVDMTGVGGQPGSKTKPNPGGTGQGRYAPKPSKSTTKSSGKKVKVYNDKGIPGEIPEEQLPEAIKQGYTVR